MATNGTKYGIIRQDYMSFTLYIVFYSLYYNHFISFSVNAYNKNINDFKPYSKNNSSLYNRENMLIHIYHFPFLKEEAAITHAHWRHN